MKKKSIIMSVLLLMLAVGMSSCSSDDENVFSPVFGEVNVLLIRSDNGKISTGTMFKNGETYNPPHCYIGKGIDYNDKYRLPSIIWVLEPTSRDRMFSTCLPSLLKAISR